MLKKSAIWIVVLMLPLVLQAQVRVSLQLDKQQYLIGDYIRVHMVAGGDSTNIYAWPHPTEISTYDYITAGPVDTVHGAGGWEIMQDMVYSVYDSGKYYFPRVALAYKKQRDTTTYYTFSDSILFIVSSVAVDTTQAIKPIKDVVDVRVIDLTWLWYLGGFLLLSLIGGGIYLFIAMKKKKEKALPVITPMSLYASTIQRLRILDDKKLWQQDLLKEYYSELTDILRYYLEHRFGVQALESTSDEILAQTYLLPVIGQFQDDLRFILYTADLAKFAKSRPLPEENIKCMQQTLAMVEATRPEEPKKEETK